MKNFKFSKDYVLGVTLKHMLRAIDISLDKTASRMDSITQEEGTEVLETLSELFALRRSINKIAERYNKDETSRW